jgi:hypothetical protein
VFEIIEWSYIVYQHYNRQYLKSNFYEETFKDRLQDTLNKLKINMTNEEGANGVVLQNNDVLTLLKITKGHVMWIVFKM